MVLTERCQVVLTSVPPLFPISNRYQHIPKYVIPKRFYFGVSTPFDAQPSSARLSTGYSRRYSSIHPNTVMLQRSPVTGVPSQSSLNQIHRSRCWVIDGRHTAHPSAVISLFPLEPVLPSAGLFLHPSALGHTARAIVCSERVTQREGPPVLFPLPFLVSSIPIALGIGRMRLLIGISATESAHGLSPRLFFFARQQNPLESWIDLELKAAFYVSDRPARFRTPGRGSMAPAASA